MKVAKLKLKSVRIAVFKIVKKYKPTSKPMVYEKLLLCHIIGYYAGIKNII